MKQQGWRLLTKRLLDTALAGSVLLAASPLAVGATCAVWLTMGRPIFFRQKRPGKHGRLFTIYKLRTMSNARDDEGNLLPDAQRLTRLGRALRAASLDEIPQLLNVIRGDLSLVGPRPLLVEYLPLYSAVHAHRHDVLPGITGWAQVNGRNSITWEKKFDLDVWYVENWSLSLDLHILAKTLWVVLSGKGISSEGSATMTPFLGTSQMEAT